MRKLRSTCRGSRLSRRGKAATILPMAAFAVLICLADPARANPRDGLGRAQDATGDLRRVGTP